MLAQRAKYEPSRHSYVAGMKNVAYLVGIVRNISPTHFYLQTTNNKNLQLPIYLPSFVKLPPWIKEGSSIKIIARVVGLGRDEELKRRKFAVVAVGFDRPNVLELPNAQAWQKRVPETADEDKTTKPFGSGYRPSSAANQVKIAGFVYAMDVREPVIDEETGETTSPRLLITVRQGADLESMFDVTYYGHLASYVAGRIKRGHPYYFEGRYRVRPIETGKMSEDGRPIIRHEPYIHVEPPQTPTVEDILFLGDENQTPNWVREMLQKTTARSVVGASNPSARTAQATPAPARHSFHEPVAAPAAPSAAEIEAARSLLG